MQEASEKKETDYSKTVIYKIQCKDPNIGQTYGGHSTNLKSRISDHKKTCNHPNLKNYNQYIYQFIRANGGWDNWQVVWQYDYPCANLGEALLEETKFIKENKCELNKNMPFVSKEEKKIKDKDYQAKKREEETEEEKKERLANEKKKRDEKLANETEEEKNARLEKNRIRSANYRAKKKAEKEAQKNLMANAELKTI